MLEILSQILIIASGVGLGASVFIVIINTPMILWNVIKIVRHKNKFKKFNEKYKEYFGDMTIDKFNKSEKKKYIILCHGRNSMVTCTDIIDYKNSSVITMDINSQINPHVVSDLSLPNALDKFENGIDGCILYICNCCTGKVNQNEQLFRKLKDILKPNGAFYTKEGGMCHNRMCQSTTSCPSSVSSDEDSDCNIKNEYTTIEKYFTRVEKLTSNVEFTPEKYTWSDVIDNILMSRSLFSYESIQGGTEKFDKWKIIDE